MMGHLPAAKSFTGLGSIEQVRALRHCGLSGPEWDASYPEVGIASDVSMGA